MRVVFIGTDPLAIMTADVLLDKGHEVVIVEPDETCIEQLEGRLDCGIIQAQGSHPSVLREVSPKNTDILFCLGTNDSDNVLASLVAKALGFKRIFTKIDDPDFKPICIELDLENVIIPDREAAKALVDTALGQTQANMATSLSGDIRFYPFIVQQGLPATVGELSLPPQTMAIAITQNGQSNVITAETRLYAGDEVVLVTHEDQLSSLKERFG
jgi:trk system potassium uptake protein TrkA